MLFDWPLAVRDGVLLSLGASAWVMVALRINPRWFLRHYPKEIRAAVPPLDRRERVLGRLVALPFLIGLVIVPAWSAATFAQIHSDASFTDVALHGFIVSMIFNVVDLLVLDIIWLGLLRPRWAMMPGAEGVAFRFNLIDHIRGFAVGTALSVMIGVGSAALILSWRHA